MKLFVKRFIALTIIISATFSCQDSVTEDIELFEEEITLTSQDVNSIVESMIVTYPVTAITDNAATTTLNSDFDMEDYAAKTSKPQITFPFEITIDGVAVTVNDMKQLKELIKKNRGRKKPQFVYPISVELDGGGTQEIADKDALRDYLDSLDEGVKPVFVFPLSLTVNNQVIEVSDENELKAIMGKPAKGRRPQLVFPLSVELDGGGTLEIADKDEFKAYLDTLADGVKPTFVFPISVMKNGDTIVVNNQEEFDALVKKPKRGKRPEFVFPISVVLDGGGTQEIADIDELKAYHQSLGKGVRPVYVFPLSIIKDGQTIVINSQEELDALCGK
jgi:hypothetical protein